MTGGDDAGGKKVGGEKVAAASGRLVHPALSLFPQMAPADFERVSVDAQFYLRCEGCSFEERYRPERQEDEDEDDEAGAKKKKRKRAEAERQLACLGCGKKTARAVVRHLVHDRGRCLDCATAFDILTGPWAVARCAACGSTRLEVETSSIEPPFPARFGERATAVPVLERKGDEPYVWGVDGVADAMRLREESAFWDYMPAPNRHATTFGLMLFAQRLRHDCSYEDPMARYLIANIEGNLAQEYFKSTGWFPAASLALELFEQMIDIAPDPINRALAQHSFAMGAFSLYAKYSEELVAAAVDRPALRESAIARAQEAEGTFQQLAADGMPNADVQVARIRWVIGDLLRVGSRDDEQRRRAVAYFDQALANEKLARGFGFALHESRGSTLAALEEPRDEELQRAAQDLGQVMQATGSDAAYAGRWRAGYALSRLILKYGGWKEALPAFQRTASLAWQQFQALGDERQTVLQSQQLAHVFGGLASLYASVGWSDEALALIEITRCSAVRLYTMDAAERERFVEQNKQKMMESLWPVALKDAGVPSLGGMPSREHIDDILEELAIGTDVLAVLSAHEGSATGILTLLEDEGIVTALLCTLVPPEATDPAATSSGAEEERNEEEPERSSSSRPRWKIDRQQWELKPRELSALQGHRHEDAGPFREQLLGRLCQQGGELLLARLVEGLRGAAVSRLFVSLPESLSGLPLEAFTDANAQPLLPSLGISVGYMPSIRLGADLVDRQQKVGVPASRSVLLVGYGGSDLAASVGEYEGIAAACGEQLTCVPGSEATKPRVLEALLGEHDIIHIQAHGTFDFANPMSSALHFASDFDDDGRRVTAFDLVNEVRFARAPLIVLSACSSAMTTGWRQGTYHGLLGSLLRAGAVGIIGSRWPVADDGTARFMIRLHRALRHPGVLPERALHAVAEELRAEGAPRELWAGFAYFGVA